LHPETEVISGNTRIYPPETYRFYPYQAEGDYRTSDSYILFGLSPEPGANTVYSQFRPKQRVLGVRFGELAMAYPFDEMGDEAVINDTLAGNPVLVVYYAAGQFALAFSREAGGRSLTFRKVSSDDPAFPFMLSDTETGSRWDLKGQAVSGALRGESLSPIPAHNAFWFAWATFWQNTGIYERGDGAGGSTDFDGNGVVNFQDFLSFAQRYGTTSADDSFEARFDLSGNGRVDFADFLLFAEGYAGS